MVIDNWSRHFNHQKVVLIQLGIKRGGRSALDQCKNGHSGCHNITDHKLSMLFMNCTTSTTSCPWTILSPPLRTNPRLSLYLYFVLCKYHDWNFVPGAQTSQIIIKSVLGTSSASKAYLVYIYYVMLPIKAINVKAFFLPNTWWHVLFFLHVLTPAHVLSIELFSFPPSLCTTGETKTFSLTVILLKEGDKFTVSIT